MGIMVALVQRLAALIKIKSVEFESIEAQRLMRGVLPREIEIDTSYSGVGQLRPNGFLEAVITYAVKARGLEQAVIAKLSCKIRVLYQFNEANLEKNGLSITPELATAFAQTSGVFNAHPYFREFLQTSCGRLGLPAIVAPPVMAGELFNRLAAETDNKPEPERAAEEKPKANLSVVPRPRRASGE
ncbi:MAG TPA: hypothetical protein VFD92_27970 [Candidatus Binatia bacterium]|nr:hypothetical protein [Candidatus Binatia bacterium]